MSYTWLDLEFFFLLYSFLGWAAEAACYAVLYRRFYNRGFLTLPFLPSYGLGAVLLLVLLPELEGSVPLQYLATLVTVSVVESIASYSIRRSGVKLRLAPERIRLFSGTGRGLLASALVAGGYYLIYLVVHPLMAALELLLPVLLVRIVVAVLLVLMGGDLILVTVAIRTGKVEAYEERQRASGQVKLAQKLTDSIWRRLQKTYPGIREADEAEEREEKYVFARGLCLNKLIWVFLTAALLGCVIEFFYCGLVNGEWMNRSSVLYGPFSFVWGLGAVVLTVTLRPLAEKNDRYVFGAGFVIGGVYEYMCSVFTELVFGTVFWDYSDMPLNIGGRTNVLFCFFWGVLAVVWIKVLYPPLSKGIERLPALTGQVLTYGIVFFMLCNAVLTGAAMLRYSARAAQVGSGGPAEAGNLFEQFLDARYGDAYMEAHWPNMITTASVIPDLAVSGD